MASSYPLLPGFAPTQDLDDFKRVSAKKQEFNRDYKPEVTNYPLPRENPVQIPDQSRTQHPDYLTTTQTSFKNALETNVQYQPSYVKLDKHVLRFQGYYKEAAVESNQELERIRKIVIYFYLEDNSKSFIKGIEIIESKQENSGIPQGAFLKRQKVLRSDNKFLSVYDFQIGQDVVIYAKNIRIYDCDQYTREFFDNIGIPQRQTQDCPIDNFNHTLQNKYVPKKDPSMMDYLEHKLGGGRVKPQKQFLQHDRKVLLFNVVAQNPYIIHYYLADDTIDIREVNFPNSGRDPFPKMLKRQKFHKKFSLNQPGQVYQEDFITPKDFTPGGSLHIYGQDFHIQSVDQFTHDFYLQNFGVKFTIKDNSAQQNFEQTSTNLILDIIIPPYNGFGDEQDSLGYVYRLVPKPPKKDFFKWVDNQIILRFLAKFQTSQPEDTERRFVIQYFCNDDSLLVYEPPRRNSGQNLNLGIVEGKFLERGKYKNQKTGEFFVQEDFKEGSVVHINGYAYEILKTDEFSEKWLQEHKIQ